MCGAKQVSRSMLQIVTPKYQPHTRYNDAQMRELVAPPVPSPAPPSSQPELNAAVRQVLESHAFERAPTLRTLLAYLWRIRDENISEYAIATEALGRSPSFDAKTDATVRVQISRL